MRRTITSLCLATAVALALASCSSAPDTPPPAESTAAQDNPAVAAGVPLHDGAVDDAVGKLDGLIDSLLRETGVPGMAVAVVSGGQTKYAKGFGVADTTTGAKVGTRTVFPLASMSKPIAATVVGAAITGGTASWDLPVAQALPGFTLADDYVTRTVTVADMFAHRSGLPDHAGDKIEDLGYPRATVLDRLRYIPLDPFRITYAYTNFGFTSGALAVAAEAGKDWETLAADSLYRPLGMDQTSSRSADFQAQPDRAAGHVQVDGKWVTTPAQRDPDAQSPAGGVSSSVDDLTHWLNLLLAQGRHGDTEIVSPDALLPAVTPQIVSRPAAAPDARAGFYGYGFNASTSAAGRATYSHSGAFSMGAATNFVVIPSADVAIVALSNAAPVGAVETLTAEFADLVQFGEITQDWRALYADAFAGMSKPTGELAGTTPQPNPAVTVEQMARHTGTYDNPLYGPAQIALDDGNLVLAMGPDGQTRYRLTPLGADSYAYSLRTENAELGSVSKVTFADGRMTVEYYADDTGDGVFVRQ